MGSKQVLPLCQSELGSNGNRMTPHTPKKSVKINENQPRIQFKNRTEITNTESLILEGKSNPYGCSCKQSMCFQKTIFSNQWQ